MKWHGRLESAFVKCHEWLATLPRKVESDPVPLRRSFTSALVVTLSACFFASLLRLFGGHSIRPVVMGEACAFALVMLTSVFWISERWRSTRRVPRATGRGGA